MLNHSSGGPIGGPTLLLVHPMGADLAFWEACRVPLESFCRCVAVDLRGAGGSPALERPVPIEGHADDLAAFCRGHLLDGVVVVGCAVGAMVAAVLAGTSAGLCRGVVLSNPGFRTLPEARGTLARRAADVRAGGMAAVMPAVVDAAFAGCPDDRRRLDYQERFARQDPLQYALQIEGMLEADTSPYLGAISAPTLIVAGGRDRLLPPDHARRVRAQIADAELLLIPEGAHFIPYQRPAEFAGLVSAFLRRANL